MSLRRVLWQRFSLEAFRFLFSSLGLRAPRHHSALSSTYEELSPISRVPRGDVAEKRFFCTIVAAVGLTLTGKSAATQAGCDL